MSYADLRRLNLNLLVALDALLDEQNVTRAARRLAVGQSAMSAMLAQLRHHFQDDLLIRSTDGMRPTPRGMALEEPLRALLRQTRMLLSQGTTFDAATADRTFKIAFLDGIEILFAPKLLQRCRECAPNVGLEIVPFERDSYAVDLDADRLDIAVGFNMAGIAHHKQRLLYREEYRVIFNSRLVEASTPISLAEYARIPHVVTRYRGTGSGAIDDALAAKGLSRTIVARTSRFLVLPSLVASSPVLATTGAKLAQLSAPGLNLTISPVPVEAGSFSINMVWHTSYDRDPGHQWCRDALLSIATAL